MISIQKNNSVLVLALLTGCSSLPKEYQALSIDQVMRACRERWGWESQTEVFGIPTVSLTPLKHPLISKDIHGVVVYRVTVFNEMFLFGSGPETFTATCLVRNNRAIFLETDDDVIEMLSSFNIIPLDAAAALDMLELFAMLRGLELQIGLPSKDNPWVVKDAGGYSTWRLGEQDPDRWTVVLDRAGNIWTVKATLVSPDEFGCDRYVIRIMSNGRIEILNKEEVLPSFTFI